MRAWPRIGKRGISISMLLPHEEKNGRLAAVKKTYRRLAVPHFKNPNSARASRLGASKKCDSLW